jgi:acyl-CoA thioesterase I
MHGALLYHVYSGQLFFSAAMLVLAAVVSDLFGWLDPRPLTRRIAAFLTVLAVPLAALSGTPVRMMLAIPAIAATLGYALFGFGSRGRLRYSLGGLASALVAIAVAIEIPYHLRHSNEPTPSHVFVIGDSLSSGGFGERTPWPEILARHLRVPVTNLALPSDSAAMALQNQIPQLSTPASRNEYAIIEIGGNDMLEGVPPDAFAAALDAILSRAGAEGRRRIVLLELPLLPGRWQYGAIQRRLAAKYDALLVPKRVLARVLLGEGNTSDGIHLRQRGHDALALELARWL